MVTLRPTGNCIKLQKLYGASNMMQCNRAFFLSTLFKNIYKVYLKSGSIKLQIYTGINNNLSVLPLRTTSKDCTILPRSLNNSSTQRSIWSAGAFFTSNKKNYSASLLVFFQDALNFWRVFSSFLVKINVLPSSEAVHVSIQCWFWFWNIHVTWESIPRHFCI